MWRVSLKLKLIGLMVTILGATVIVSYIIFERSGQALLRQVVQHVKSLESVGNTLEIEQMFTTPGDLTITRKMLVPVSQRGEIAQISLLDAQRRVIASSNPEDVGLTLTELERRRVSDATRSFWDTFLQDHIKRYDITLPILENGRKTGYLNVIFVMNDLEYLIKKAKYSNIAWIVSIFAVGVLAAILMVQRFTRPIDQLVAASKAVAQGDFDTTVPVRSHDEFDTLITGFNDMTRTLKAHQALEERYRRSQRMAALGELGARLAHEIRNPLHSISLIIDHLRDRFAPADPEQQQKFDAYVGNMRTELTRLNKLVTDFLQVSRPSRPERRPVPVAGLLQQVQQLLAPEAEKYQIQVTLDVQPPDLSAAGDDGLLQTAGLNIALNAIQAMPSGGELRMVARPSADLKMCEIAFRDTGPGIPPEDCDNIFQPYFTTKPDGTGLGLAIVNRVVADHQGTIQVESAPGQGAVITLALPRAEQHGREDSDR
jgi:signal transduction histidine kinase